jgi:HSP20 family protein
MNLVKRNNANRVFPTIMDELFKDLMGGTQYVQKTLPPVNMWETEQSFTIELMAPGLEKKDFDIQVDNALLTISSERKGEQAVQEEVKYTRKEFTFASFKRSFSLPETINEEGINASYQNGILAITLPKKEEALPKAKRLVAIS